MDSRVYSEEKNRPVLYSIKLEVSFTIGNVLNKIYSQWIWALRILWFAMCLNIGNRFSVKLEGLG